MDEQKTKQRNGYPRIVLVTGDGLEHRYVANRLASELELAGIIVDHGRRVGILERSRALWRRYTVPQLLSRVCLSVLRRLYRNESHRTKKLKAVFGVENCSDFRQGAKLFPVFGVNTVETVNTIASLRPDILLV